MYFKGAFSVRFIFITHANPYLLEAFPINFRICLANVSRGCCFLKVTFQAMQCIIHLVSDDFILKLQPDVLLRWIAAIYYLKFSLYGGISMQHVNYCLVTKQLNELFENL